MLLDLYPWEGLTLPTSTRFVTMTMLAEFSCQIILQKSFTVSCMGPANREGVRVRLQWQGSRQEACPSRLVGQGSGWVSKREVSDSYWDTSSGDWGLKRVRSECTRKATLQLAGSAASPGNARRFSSSSPSCSDPFHQPHFPANPSPYIRGYTFFHSIHHDLQIYIFLFSYILIVCLPARF